MARTCLLLRMMARYTDTSVSSRLKDTLVPMETMCRASSVGASPAQLAITSTLRQTWG